MTRPVTELSYDWRYKMFDLGGHVVESNTGRLMGDLSNLVSQKHRLKESLEPYCVV